MAELTQLMRVNLNGFILKNPIMTASGTSGSSDEYGEFFDVSKLGALVTKAVTLNPRAGNRNTRIIETEAGMINSIGLENGGIEDFLTAKLPVLKSKHIDFVMNAAGSTMEEYIKLAQICEKEGIKAVEMNVSCPNVKSGCLEFGTDEDTLYELVSRVREVYRGFLIVKLTPNVTSIEKIGLAAQRAGADAASAINTIKGSRIVINLINNIPSLRRGVREDGAVLNEEKKRFQKTIVSGGYSGKGIKPAAISAVLRLSNVLDIPVIGIGGIETLEDVLEFFAAGAEAVQIGTSAFTHPETAGRLVNELEEFIIKNGFRNLDELKKELRA